MKKVFAFILMLVLPVALAAQNTTIDPNHDYTNPHRDLGNTSYIDWNRILDDYWPVSTITFKVGQLSFKGTIENTKPPLSVLLKQIITSFSLQTSKCPTLSRRLRR